MTTLRNELKKHRGHLVKVGVASGFIYIHEVDDSTLDDIKTINEAYRENMRMLIASNKKALETYETTYYKRYARAKEAKREGWTKMSYGKRQKLSDVSIRKYKKLLNTTQREREEHVADIKSKHLSRKRRYEYHLKNDLPMLDREVLDVYSSFEDPDVVIIKIEGVEEGAYWFPHEFEKAKASGRIVMRLFEEYEEDEEEEE